MVKASSIDAQDKQWQKEYDARTLADAEEIRSNSARLKGGPKRSKTNGKRNCCKGKSNGENCKTRKTCKD